MAKGKGNLSREKQEKKAATKIKTKQKQNSACLLRLNGTGQMFVIQSGVFLPMVLHGFLVVLSCFILLGTLVTLPSATSHVFLSLPVCVSLPLVLSVSFTHQFSQTARSF